MARIDLTSIPNAPQLNAPELQSAAPVVEGMGRLKQESMPLDAFSGEARGMQAVGQGVGQLATPLNTFAQAFSRAQTAADNAKIKIELEDWKTRLIDKTNQLPPDQRDKAWQEAVPELEKTLNAMDISPAARDKRDPEMIRFLGETRIAIQHGARLQKIADQQDVISTAAQKAMDNGNYEEAVAQIQTGVNSYIFSKPQGDKIIQKIQDNQKRQVWQQVINSDPFSALETLQQDTKNGTSDTFKGANPVELARLTETARSEVNRQRVDATRSIENQIDAGLITTVDQIKEAGGKAIDPVALQGLENRMKNQNGPDPEKWMGIMDSIHNLDPKSQDFLERFHEIQTDINKNVGSTWRGSMNSLLYNKLAKSQKGEGLTVDEKIQTAGFQRIKYLFDNGAFGQFKVKKDANGNVDPKQLAGQTDAYNQAMAMNDALVTAMKEGKVPNSYQGMNNWINDQLNDAQKKILGSKLNQPQAEGMMDKAWNAIKSATDSLIPSVPDSAIRGKDDKTIIPTPQDIRAKLDGKTSQLPPGAIPAPKGSKITNYWPSEAKGTDGIIGNHKNKLTDGDFAASPDVLASLKENGAKPGDPVLIHLSDGSTVPARFNDSTATDDQQKAKGKAPLRGRFDVWTTTKGHPKDGVAVIGYSLPNRQS